MIKGNLAVRINDGRQDRVVSKLVSDLSFGSVAPGGHAAISFRLAARFDGFDIDGSTKVYVYDTRTTETLCEGYAEDPGREYNTEGEGFQVQAYGGSALLTDQSEKLIYLDTTLDQWRKDDLYSQTPSGTGESGIFPEDAGTRAGDAGLFCQFTPGQPITTLAQTGVTYDAFVGSSMHLGGFACFHDGGMGDANYKIEAVVAPYLGEGLSLDVSLTFAGAAVARYAGGANLPIDKTALTLRLVRRAGGATNVAADNVWTCFGEAIILGQLLDRYGALRPMATAAHVTAINVDPFPPVTAYILAHEVVEDLLGRILTFCDPTSARIDAATHQIDQLAYHDGARAADVFNDLILFEPDFLHEVLETNAAGLHRFAYRAWDTEPRYELSTNDGYNQPGSETDAANRMAVYWVDTKGTKRTTVVTSATVVRGGGWKDAESVDLGERVGSAANATRIGTEILAAQNAVSKAATAQVARKVLDRYTGCYVNQWEMKAGYPAMVRETGDVLRVTETKYTDSDETMALTLGTPARTRDQIVADLTRGRR